MSMLANRLRKRQRHLRKWGRRRGITCYRLYERDIPEYPCIVDWYAGDVVAWLYQRKRDETEAQAKAWAQQTLDEIQQGLEIDSGQLFVKARFQQGEDARYSRLQQREATRVVEEQGLCFEVNLSDYLDTGLFLDHRTTRAQVRDRAQGKRVLNLFAYTGSFTCYAIDGGASHTTTIDLSRTYCDWARRNLTHNGFVENNRHRILQGDVLAFLAEEIRARHRYNIIICDPPTFSNSKRMDSSSFSIVRDQTQLIGSCARLLATNGELYFSTNARRFQLAQGPHLRSLQIEELTPGTIPEDFRNQKIHRCWRMTRTE